MNTPTDPFGLLIYGVATLIVILGLKVWDRRRDGKLLRATTEARDQATAAAEHASTAAGHASSAAAASGRAEETTASRASSQQAQEQLQVGHDTNAILIRLAMSVGEMRAEVRLALALIERVNALERHMDDVVLPDTARRRHDR